MVTSTRATSLPISLAAGGATDIGQRRVHNEDAILMRPDLALFVLADGAGGHNAGNVASMLATTSIANYFEASLPTAETAPDFDRFGLATGARRLAIALQHANRDIVEIANSSNKRKGMGCTVVATAFSSTSSLLHIAYVGDSRCYRLRSGFLEQLTHDHSLLNDVLEVRPDIEDAQLDRMPRNVVTRALGMEETVRVSVRSHRVAPGDRYLLCSDGLTDNLSDEAILDALSLQHSPQQLADLLVNMANEAGGNDNIAAIVLFAEAGSPLAPPRRRSIQNMRAVSVPRAETQPERAAGSGTATDSPPEIVLVEESADADDEPQIHVVPPESATDDLLLAVTPVADATRVETPSQAASAWMFQCGHCGELFDADQSACPHCGTPAEGET